MTVILALSFVLYGVLLILSAKENKTVADYLRGIMS